MTRVVIILLVAAALVAGCDGEIAPTTEIAGIPFYDLTDDGAPFLVHSRELLRETLEVGTEFWGSSPDALRELGLHVVLRERTPCGDAAAGGCFTGDRVELSMYVMGYRAESVSDIGGALVHELGHAAKYARTGDWDALHADPRWAELPALYRSLYAR